MQVVTPHNEDHYRELVLVRDYLADPSAGPDPLTVISRDPVAAQVLRVLCDAAEHQGQEAYRAALRGMPDRLRAMAVRLTMALAHQARIDAGDDEESNA